MPQHKNNSNNNKKNIAASTVAINYSCSLPSGKVKIQHLGDRQERNCRVTQSHQPQQHLNTPTPFSLIWSQSTTQTRHNNRSSQADTNKQTNKQTIASVQASMDEGKGVDLYQKEGGTKVILYWSNWYKAIF